MGDVTLYFHIGATKTGSTALQRFLEQNFSELLALGVLYPNFHDGEFYAPMQPGFNYWQGFYFHKSDASKDRRVFNRIIHYSRKHSVHSIVISHEALLANSVERLGRLAGRLDAQIKIICYVRRQDHHLESAWKQWGYKFVDSKDLLASRSDPRWRRWTRTDWYEMITPWADAFGIQNIIIRPYEHEQLPDGILPDFLETIKVQWPQKPELKDSSNINPGFSRDVLEIMHLNRQFYEDFMDQRLYEVMNQLLRDASFRKQPFEAYGILSPQDRIELLKEYEPSNQRLAREFLDRPDGRLFYEPWPEPDESWEPYQGLTVERAVPVLTAMIYKLYQQQSRQKRENESS